MLGVVASHGMTPSIGDPPVPARFWKHVEADENGCWIWTAARNFGGYGLVRFVGRNHMAHRTTYEAFVEAILPWRVLDHLCRNPSCCNPAHLEAVTPKENVRRSYANGIPRKPPRRKPPRTECGKGHPLTDDNVYLSTDGRRRCRACQRIFDATRRERRRVEGQPVATSWLPASKLKEQA